MARDVKLSRIEDVLSELSYPVTRESAAEELDDVTLQLADGEASLGGVLEDVPSDSFDSVGELRDEIFEYLPEAAIGEPGQSEGDA
jgi:hypothetical protein